MSWPNRSGTVRNRVDDTTRVFYYSASDFLNQRSLVTRLIAGYSMCLKALVLLGISSQFAVSYALADGTPNLFEIPTQTIVAEQPFNYRVVVDADTAQQTGMRLVNAPKGATLTNNGDNSYQFNWTPPADVGEKTVIIVQAYNLANPDLISTQRVVLLRGNAQNSNTEATASSGASVSGASVSGASVSGASVSGTHVVVASNTAIGSRFVAPANKTASPNNTTTVATGNAGDVQPIDVEPKDVEPKDVQPKESHSASTGYIPKFKTELPVVKPPVVNLPVIKSPEAQTPAVGEAKTAKVESAAPVVNGPVVESPKVKSPVVDASKVKESKVGAPKVESPVVNVPVVESPVVTAPEVKPTEVKPTEFKSPEFKSPEFKSDVKSPVVKAPEVESGVVESPIVETEQTVVDSAPSNSAQRAEVEPKVESIASQRPELPKLGLQRLTVGKEFQFFIRPETPDDVDVTMQLSAESLPAGATIEDVFEGSKMLRWQPSADQVGTHQMVLALVAEDETRLSLRTEREVVFVVEPAPPVELEPEITLEPISAQIVSAGRKVNIRVKPVVSDNKTAQVHVDRLPAGGSFDENKDGTRTFHWPTTQADEGEHTFRFTAIHPDNADLVASANVLIVVGSPDGPTSGPSVVDVSNAPPSPELDSYPSAESPSPDSSGAAPSPEPYPSANSPSPSEAPFPTADQASPEPLAVRPPPQPRPSPD